MYKINAMFTLVEHQKVEKPHGQVKICNLYYQIDTRTHSLEKIKLCVHHNNANNVAWVSFVWAKSFLSP